MNIHPTVQEAAELFIRAGKQIYLVGGAVRDLLRGKRAKDWDLATDALPGEVMAIFKRKSREAAGKFRCFVVPTGFKHGTVTVYFKDLGMEVTTFRSESGYTDGRRPDKVEFGSSMEADLSRRDFTMNAAAYKLPGGPLLDPFDGRKDIKRKIIRCVGNPEERFSEDGLRPLRAVRFASQLGFSVDEKLLAAIEGALPFTARVAAERIRDELDKIIASDKPSAALSLMEKTGLLELLIPELSACRGVEQKGFHRFDVLDHSLLACDFAARESGFDGAARGIISLAALFHDIGKPLTAQKDSAGAWTFYRHEKESARLAREILGRLRYPNIVKERAAHLIEEHMFHYDETWKDAAVRRFIIRVGEDQLPGLYALRHADAYGMAGVAPPPDFLLPLMKRVDTVLARSTAFTVKDLAVSGADLMAAGIPAGKYMGIILKELLETVVDDPGLNTREKLLEIAGNLRERYQ